jgi:hypothetical protein
MVDVDLSFITSRLDRLLIDVAAMRDDIAVLAAMVTRQDATINALVQEMRITHQQIARIVDRVRRLEEAT